MMNKATGDRHTKSSQENTLKPIIIIPHQDTEDVWELAEALIWDQLLNFLTNGSYKNWVSQD